MVCVKVHDARVALTLRLMLMRIVRKRMLVLTMRFGYLQPYDLKLLVFSFLFDFFQAGPLWAIKASSVQR